MEIARRNALNAQLWIWLKRKERYWFQMSRTKAIIEKDKNTKYFHLLASLRKTKNFIGKLKVDGRLVSNPRIIKKETVNFFKKLYSADHSIGLKHNGIGFACLSQGQKEGLDCILLEEEIKGGWFEAKSSKAPGYDGFNIGFVKKLWNTVGEDFIQMITSFF